MLENLKSIYQSLSNLFKNLKNVYSFFTTIYLSFELYAFSFAVKEYTWANGAAFVVYLSTWITFILNYVFTSWFLLEIHKHKFIDASYYLNYTIKYPNWSILCKFIDVISYADSGLVKDNFLCSRLDNIQKEVKQELKRKACFILAIGLLLKDIPQGSIAIHTLRMTNSDFRFKFDSYSSLSNSAMFSIIGVIFSIVTTMYSLVMGTKILKRKKKTEEKLELKPI